MRFAPELRRCGYALGQAPSRLRIVWSAVSATIVAAIALAAFAPGEDAHAESQRRAAHEEAQWFAFDALPRWAP